MRALLRRWVLPFVNPKQLASVFLLPKFLLEFHAYRGSSHERVTLADTYPCLADRMSHTPFDPHYFFQGAWLARELVADAPARHVDVGSSVLLMSTVSALVPIVFVDYRPLRAALPGLECVAGDVCRLPFRTGSVKSLSCLHVIEHIGLGRYGDPIDPDGSTKAASELARVVAPGGRLYLSAPVGRPRVCFNAHRVFAPEVLPRMFAGLRVATFSFVDDAGMFHHNADPAAAASSEYGCGMYVMARTA